MSTLYAGTFAVVDFLVVAVADVDIRSPRDTSTQT
jgi:hypothetical protein